MNRFRPSTFVQSKDGPALCVLILWTGFYLWRALIGHFSLGTNAYDLSVFDYALWSSLRGEIGFVPFLGHSIFSHHFMPILFVVLPLYAAFQSPVFLIVIQIAATAGAGWLFHRFQSEVGLQSATSAALLLVFLLSRRSHSASSSAFYPESFQAILTFACVLTWVRGRWLAYWICAVLLLMTKEDASVYLGSFAGLQLLTGRGSRRPALLTVAVSVVWLAFAVGVAIPASRTVDGVPPANPFIEARFASESGSVEAGILVDRLVSWNTATRFVDLLLATGFLPLAGLQWFTVAVPGMLINMVARADTMQAALIGHYAWPILPWLFMAAAQGAVRLQRRSARAALVWSFLLVGGTLIDSPAIRGIPNTRLAAEAQIVRRQLRDVQGPIILSQPNLVPHLSHTHTVFTLGGGHQPSTAADVVLLTTVGDLWPFGREEIDTLIRRYQSHPDYEQVSSGPLYLFERRGPRSNNRLDPAALLIQARRGSVR